MKRTLPIMSLAMLISMAQAADKPSGQAVYEHWCAPCHAPGPGHPGTQSLQIKYGGKTPAVLLERTDLSPQAVAVFVRQGVLLMAPFRKTEITDAELAALTAYVAQNFKSR
jgi:mono/diheme cytochrome c family protein